MMYREMAKMMYFYIIKAEMVFLRLYKTNPLDLMKQMTLLDLNMYINQIQTEEKKDQNQMKSNKHIMECLKGINDYLNMLFYKK